LAKSSGSTSRSENLRSIAVTVLADVVFQQLNLDQALAAHSAALRRLSNADVSLLKAICFGCLRDWLALLELSQHYLQKPIRNKDRLLQVVLVVGIYQLLSMRVPDHAAISQTVSVVEVIGKGWAKAMINAVLRAVQRDRDNGGLPPAKSPPARFNHPAWLLDRIEQDWPQQKAQIIAANNQQAAMDLRSNRLYWQREQALDALRQAEIAASPIDGLDCGLRLATAQDVAHIPQFHQGGFSVQDAAAQLAAPLIDLHPGQRVLDACAAPGGKTAHLLETQPGITLLAIDIEKPRVALIGENLRRLRLHGDDGQPGSVSQAGGEVRIITADAANAQQWWQQQPFDRILLDAPCSATGVIRRHPEIKLLRQADDIARLSRQQQRILEQLWPLLQSEGMLLYVTCSILRQENDEVIAAFIDAHKDTVMLQTLQLPWGRATAFGWQILPGDNDSDGFYYACLKKRNSAA